MKMLNEKFCAMRLELDGFVLWMVKMLFLLWSSLQQDYVCVHERVIAVKCEFLFK
uniref:Uncharacterized protein n=1 Tax=Rhizophora mucronata TaxID=61149 RepID=A0A2P2MZR3_RHIMU